MMGLRRTVQSLLGYPDEKRGSCTGRCCRPVMKVAGDSGLRCVAGNLLRQPANFLAAAAIGPEAPAPPEKPTEMTLYDGSGGGTAASLELCTESLGFESCSEGKTGAEGEKTAVERSCPEKDARMRKTTRRTSLRKREFPPPLPWLSGGGTSSSYLRAVKKDGRLILSEVLVERPESLRATRHSGRLRLELVK